METKDTNFLPLKVDKLKYVTKQMNILRNVTFDLPKNSLVALVGKNGAGKTTTIKCILGLIRNYEGNIFINGINNRDSRARDHVAYIPEKEDLPNYSVLSFLLQSASYYGLKQREGLDRIQWLCKMLQFDPQRLKLRTKQLSSGLKKIVMIMQAFLSNATLIITDEPTANLDFESRLLFYDLVKYWIKNKGVTFLTSSHDLFEIKEFADSYVQIKDGEANTSLSLSLKSRKTKE